MERINLEIYIGIRRHNDQPSLKNNGFKLISIHSKQCIPK